MLTILALIACGPGAITIEDDLQKARPGETDPGDADDSGDTNDSGSDTDDSGDSDDSGNVGWAEVDDDGDGYSEDDGDCDDGDATINPDAEEVWYDGVNQNCDDYSDYDQNGDGEDSWYVYGGEDCDDDSDGYYAVDCPALNGNNTRPDCDDRYATVNPEEHEDNTDAVDNNCNDVIDGLSLDIEWSISYECVEEICIGADDYDYVGTMTLMVSDDDPDKLVLLGGGSINTAEPIDLADSAHVTDEFEIEVVAGGTPNSGDGTTSFGDQAETVSYLYLSSAAPGNGPLCVVWGPRADVLATYEVEWDCVDITDLVGEEGPNQHWNGLYE